MEERATSILKKAKNLFEGGRFSEAEELLSSFEGEEGPATVILNFRAYLLYREGRVAEAAEVYRRLSEMEPDDPSHFSNLGLTLYKQKLIHEALEAFERQLALRPGDRKALRNLGFCYRQLGQEKRAEKCFRQAGEGGAALPEKSRVRPSATREKAGMPGMAEGRRVQALGTDVSDLDFVELRRWIDAEAVPMGDKGGEIVRTGPGGFACQVEEKIFLKRRHLLSYRGVIVFSSASRAAKKAARKFGDGQSEFLKAEGTGEIRLSGGGLNLHAFHLGEGGERVFFNFPALVSHGPEIDISYQENPAVRGAFMAIEITGSDRLVIALRGAPAVLDLPRDLPVFVRPGAVVGWTGDLTYEVEASPPVNRFEWLAGREKILRFDGRGSLVLQDMNSR